MRWNLIQGGAGKGNSRVLQKVSGPEYEQMKWIGIKVEEDIILVDQR